MDWKDLAGTLIKTGAPIIGGALGGPLGATVGGFAGKLVADALGVAATPEAVHEAIQADPAGAAVALASADAKWQAMAEIAKAEAADRTAQSQAINETVRTEIATGMSWWHWRNLLGYVPVVIGAEIAGMVPFVALGKFTAADMVAIITAITPLVVTFSGLLGYVAQDTTKLKTTAITGEHAPSMMDTTVKAIKAAVSKPVVKVVQKPAGSKD
jgi:hypothetical protein